MVRHETWFPVAAQVIGYNRGHFDLVSQLCWMGKVSVGHFRGHFFYLWLYMMGMESEDLTAVPAPHPPFRKGGEGSIIPLAHVDPLHGS